MKVQNDFLYVEQVVIWMLRVQKTQRRSRMLSLYQQSKEGAKTKIDDKLTVEREAQK